MDVDPSSAALGFILGLGNLNHRNTCVGYQYGCTCEECEARSESVNPVFLEWLDGRGPRRMPRLFRAPVHAAQPWEIKAA